MDSVPDSLQGESQRRLASNLNVPATVVSLLSEMLMFRRLSICLINPRSRPPYWTADYAMPFYGLGRKLKYPMAHAALASVADPAPPQQGVLITDQNAEPVA